MVAHLSHEDKQYKNIFQKNNWDHREVSSGFIKTPINNNIPAEKRLDWVLSAGICLLIPKKTGFWLPPVLEFDVLSKIFSQFIGNIQIPEFL